MNRADVARDLDEARTAGTARARMLLHSVLVSIGEPWVDAATRAEIDALALRCGYVLPPAVPRSLEVGETWLLVVGPEGRGDVLRLCARADHGEGGDSFDDEVVRALRGLRAAAEAQRRHLAHALFFRRFTIAGIDRPAAITGSSLGLSACIAALSLAVGRAPYATVAGSAAVGERGELRPVDAIAAKASALRSRWPEVDTLVVAEGQEGALEGIGLRIVRAASLVEAASAFGLTFPEGGAPTSQALRRRVDALRDEEVSPHSAEDWWQLSVEAEALADDLAGVERIAALDALLLAAQLASHAGHPRRARALLDRFRGVEAPEELLARERVIRAAACIDAALEEALVAAVDGVARCSRLTGMEREKWLGRALGTHGRVLLHAGRADDAEPLLRAAHEHHGASPDEHVRSALHLAPCLRRLGRAEEALALSTDALARLEARDRSEQTPASRLHAHLERGRALLDLGRADDAIDALENVLSGQTRMASYPGLGARRTLVRACRQAMKLGAARRYLGQCIEVAMAPSAYDTLRKVGAVAAAEELLGANQGRQPSELLAPRELLEGAWAACFAEPATAELIARWVY